jgi:Lar family restriction alleviation protein
MDTNNEALRAEFEAWARKNGCDLDREQDTGDYAGLSAYKAWAAWQAARASAAPAAAPAPGVPTRLDVMSLIREQCHRVYESAIDSEEIDTKYMREIEDAIARLAAAPAAPSEGALERYLDASQKLDQATDNLYGQGAQGVKCERCKGCGSVPIGSGEEPRIVCGICHGTGTAPTAAADGVETVSKLLKWNTELKRFTATPSDGGAGVGQSAGVAAAPPECQHKPGEWSKCQMRTIEAYEAMREPALSINEESEFAKEFPVPPPEMNSDEKDEIEAALPLLWQGWKARANLAQQLVDQHPDDVAVNRFAAAMKAKLAASRAKGRGGWDDPKQCNSKKLAEMLVDHVRKGDPVDIGNFAMMLHHYQQQDIENHPCLSNEVPNKLRAALYLGENSMAWYGVCDALSEAMPDWHDLAPCTMHAAPIAIAALAASAPAAAGVQELEPVEGDLLPPVGSKVLIHLGRQDAWVEHTVSGYYVWGALSHQIKEGEKNAHRVFVRVKDAQGYDNARLLSEVLPVSTAPASEPVKCDMADAYVGAREDLAIWKKRALDAEESCRRLTAALNAENGPTFMGDPVKPEAAQAGEVFPCPFCGSRNISDGEVSTTDIAGETVVQSMCEDCGACGPGAALDAGEIDYGDVKAIAAWNRRAAQPASGEVADTEKEKK